MTLEVLEKVIGKTQTRPDIVIGVPPTDNRRMIATRSGRRVLSTVARNFVAEYKKVRPLLPEPPIVLLYRVCWPDRRKRDAQNIVKCMCDALYEEDQFVYPWAVPFPGVDRKEPRVDIWFLPVSEEDWNG